MDFGLFYRAPLFPRALWVIARDRALAWFSNHGAGLLGILRWATEVLHAKALSLKLLMLQHRLKPTPQLTQTVRAQLPNILARIPALIPPSPLREVPKKRLVRALVLSLPRMNDGTMQRGVMLIKFTEVFRFFYHLVDIPLLLRFFRIVLEPSWSGYCLPEILFWAQYPDPILVQSSEALDRRFLEDLQTNLQPIHIGASDWVDYRVFRPLGLERTYDVIYVANLAPIKRVHVLLKSLRKASRKGRELKALLVLSSWGGNTASFEQLLDFYEVRSSVTVLRDLDQQRLNECLNRAKVSVLLSRKEGSNKTLFESMFANTAVLLLKNNIGVNKDYVNPHTGRLVDESELPEALVDLSERFAEYSPRSWAMQHIAPEISTSHLERSLTREDPSAVALPLFVKVNSPEAIYMDPKVAEAMPSIRDVLSCFLKTSGSPGESDFRALLDARSVKAGVEGR
jgi:glycosyltransferase involved in cell wall biosynthesis